MIKSTYNSGFTLEFPSGINVSVTLTAIKDADGRVYTKAGDVIVKAMVRDIAQYESATITVYDKGKVIPIDGKANLQLKTATEVAQILFIASSSKHAIEFNEKITGTHGLEEDYV